ncbi:hypothetical protein HDV05_003993 [Chytridiales sp. JEL 0842]|nr:hypothetical protein HDV05_003993 [Chytridiales sp. JEL 0842]
MKMDIEGILEMQEKVFTEKNFAVLPWEAVQKQQTIVKHQQEKKTLMTTFKTKWEAYVLDFKNPDFEEEFMEWNYTHFVLCMQGGYICGFAFSIFHAFADIESFCNSAVRVRSPSICRDSSFGNNLFYIRVLFFPLLNLVCFGSTFLKMKPWRMQIMVTIQNVIQCVANVHLYCHVAAYTPGRVADETVKLFLVALYITIMTLSSSSSLRCKYFIMFALFIAFYFLLNIFIYKLPILQNAQNLLIFIFLLIYGVFLAHHCEEEERRYFALMKLTLATMTSVGAENAKVMIEVEQLHVHGRRKGSTHGDGGLLMKTDAGDLGMSIEGQNKGKEVKDIGESAGGLNNSDMTVVKTSGKWMPAVREMVRSSVSSKVAPVIE